MRSYEGVMIIGEQHEGNIHPVTFELLGKGREIAEELNCKLYGALLGHRVRELAKELIYHGADEVFILDHPSLKYFDPVNYKHNLVKLINMIKPELILVGATNIGRSLAPRIAAALRTGLTADCIDIRVDESKDIIQVRPAFTGNIIAHIKTKMRPVMATVRYRVMKPLKRDTSRKGKIIEVKVEDIGDTGITIMGKLRDKEVSIAEADIIVSCGRGLKRSEDIKMIKELAELLGGVIGCSKPLVDEGWMTRDHQVGFSGNVVKPRLYIACGISGSPQHLAGMRDSEIIVAINLDPSAPIFRFADYGIVGDLYEVIPKLIEEIKKRRSNFGRESHKGA